MKVYISNYLSKSISILNYSTFEVENEIKLEDIHPNDFCLDTESEIMYIPGSNDGILYLLDLTTHKIIDNISIGGNLSHIVLYNEELFISNEDSNSIYILDKNTCNPICMIEVDEMPHGFDYDENKNKLYVSCINSIICIDLIEKNIYNKINTEFKLWNIKVDKLNKEIYTTTLEGKIIIFNENNKEIINIIDDFLLPTQICFDYTHNKIYVLDIGYQSIITLDYNTRKIIDCIEIEGIPHGLSISKDDKLLFISDTKKNIIKIYDTENKIFIKDVKVGKEPTTILCV